MTQANDPQEFTPDEWKIDPLAGATDSMAALMREALVWSPNAWLETGLTMRQFVAFLLIAKTRKIGLAELAEQLEQGSAWGIVNRLEAMNLVERQTDPADHRRVDVHLTETGNDLLITLVVTLAQAIVLNRADSLSSSSLSSLHEGLSDLLLNTRPH